jgi:hypothetical protein
VMAAVLVVTTSSCRWCAARHLGTVRPSSSQSWKGW